MSRRPREAILLLGSNIEPDRWVPCAVAALRQRLEVVAVSRPYRSAAVGAPGAPAFVNAALHVRTDLGPRALRAVARRVEEICRRERTSDANAPRTMDVDVVWMDGPPCAADDLVLPAPDLLDHAYALVPAAEAHPDAVHPRTGRTLADHATALPEAARARLVGLEALPEAS